MSNTNKYELVCGLEIHVELNTRSKMFCGCKNDPFGAPVPNCFVCPVCLGLPGALPVLNKKAIESTVLLGLALGATINRHSKFDRKHYTYPDLPKGYQITQYELPFCLGSALPTMEGPASLADESRRVRIRRVHLEEDTAKLIHVKSGESRIDFNRSGVPLLELVTEPDIKTAAQAKEFAKRLRSIIRYLGISDADLERGNMRLEASVSLRPKGDTTLPDYKVELKNINSFGFLEKAILFEIGRQSELLEGGTRPDQETRGWDESTGRTLLQRSKENAEDYRYFPDPDIPPIELSEAFIQEQRLRVPELPAAAVARWSREYGIEERYAAMFSEEREEKEKWEMLFRGLHAAGVSVRDFVKDAANKRASFSFDTPVSAIVEFYRAGNIAPPSVEAMREAIAAVLSEETKAVKDYAEGNESALQFLMGRTLKKLKTKTGIDLLREELTLALRSR